MGKKKEIMIKRFLYYKMIKIQRCNIVNFNIILSFIIIYFNDDISVILKYF